MKKTKGVLLMCRIASPSYSSWKMMKMLDALQWRIPQNIEPAEVRVEDVVLVMIGNRGKTVEEGEGRGHSPPLSEGFLRISVARAEQCSAIPAEETCQISV